MLLHTSGLPLSAIEAGSSWRRVPAVDVLYPVGIREYRCWSNMEIIGGQEANCRYGDQRLIALRRPAWPSQAVVSGTALWNDSPIPTSLFLTLYLADLDGGSSISNPPRILGRSISTFLVVAVSCSLLLVSPCSILPITVGSVVACRSRWEGVVPLVSSTACDLLRSVFGRHDPPFLPSQTIGRWQSQSLVGKDHWFVRAPGTMLHSSCISHTDCLHSFISSNL